MSVVVGASPLVSCLCSAANLAGVIWQVTTESWRMRAAHFYTFHKKIKNKETYF
jgi:hypothetical protein